MRISLVYIFGYFVVLLRTSWYFLVLLRTSWYFLVLLGTQGGGEQKGQLEWEITYGVSYGIAVHPIQNQNNTPHFPEMSDDPRKSRSEKR